LIITDSSSLAFSFLPLSLYVSFFVSLSLSLYLFISLWRIIVRITNGCYARNEERKKKKEKK